MLMGCGVSFEQASKPIIEKYGLPDQRTKEKDPYAIFNEEDKKTLGKSDVSSISWGYLNPRIIVVFLRTGNKWEAKIKEY
jgi:hypothetical protein